MSYPLLKPTNLAQSFGFATPTFPQKRLYEINQFQGTLLESQQKRSENGRFSDGVNTDRELGSSDRQDIGWRTAAGTQRVYARYGT